MANYDIKVGIKKFFKVAVITFITAWAASHAAGLDLFLSPILLPTAEASLLAGAVYAVDNYRKHR